MVITCYAADCMHVVV